MFFSTNENITNYQTLNVGQLWKCCSDLLEIFIIILLIIYVVFLDSIASMHHWGMWEYGNVRKGRDIF